MSFPKEAWCDLVAVPQGSSARMFRLGFAHCEGCSANSRFGVAYFQRKNKAVFERDNKTSDNM